MLIDERIILASTSVLLPDIASVRRHPRIITTHLTKALEETLTVLPEKILMTIGLPVLFMHCHLLVIIGLTIVRSPQSANNKEVIVVVYQDTSTFHFSPYNKRIKTINIYTVDKA